MTDRGYRRGLLCFGRSYNMVMSPMLRGAVLPLIWQSFHIVIRRVLTFLGDRYERDLYRKSERK